MFYHRSFLDQDSVDNSAAQFLDNLVRGTCDELPLGACDLIDLGPPGDQAEQAFVFLHALGEYFLSGLLEQGFDVCGDDSEKDLLLRFLSGYSADRHWGEARVPIYTKGIIRNAG